MVSRARRMLWRVRQDRVHLVLPAGEQSSGAFTFCGLPSSAVVAATNAVEFTSCVGCIEGAASHRDMSDKDYVSTSAVT
jgi:hypothetical protein